MKRQGTKSAGGCSASSLWGRLFNFVLAIMLVLTLSPSSYAFAVQAENESAEAVSTELETSNQDNGSEDSLLLSEDLDTSHDESDPTQSDELSGDNQGSENKTSDVEVLGSIAEDAGQPVAESQDAELSAPVAATRIQMRSPQSVALNADDANVGTIENPYDILIGEGAFCAPSAFWSATGASSGQNGIADMVVGFRQTDNNMSDGTTLFSYLFDTSKSDPNHLNDSWTYAFRFNPYTAHRVLEDGTLEIGTASKGSFDWYFPSFQYKVNVAALTASLAADLQMNPGDTVSLVYYGAFDQGQTSRGTNYAVDLSKTDEQIDESAAYQAECVVDSQGFITVDPLPHGGNYRIVKGSTSEAPAIAKTYSQSDGYEPYVGWQNSPWQEAGDPDYDSTGGTTRKGWPAWSLSDPLSVGVTDYNGALITGSDVNVVTDTNACNTTNPVEATYENPWYYKNIILPSYDVSGDEISFTFNTVAPGGAGVQVSKVLSRGGFIVATSPDPSTWSGEDSTVVWRAQDNNHDVSVSQVRDNWWQRIKLAVSTETLEDNQTYYLAIQNGTAAGWGRIYADIVFEFNTGLGNDNSWTGSITNAAYGRDQGNGGTKLGMTEPSPSVIRTNLSMVNSAYYNTITTPMEAVDGAVSFVVHAEGSGSNWQLLSTWTGGCSNNVAVYEADAWKAGNANPVASYANGTLAFSLVNADRDWPQRDGIRISASGLQGGKTYCLVFDENLMPQTTNPLGKPVAFEFQLNQEASNAWEIGADDPSAVTASFADDGVLTISGVGAIKDFSADELPGFAGRDIKRVVIGSGITSIGSNVFAGNEGIVAMQIAGTLDAVGENAFATGASGMTVYVPTAADATKVVGSAGLDKTQTAVAVMNGGEIASDTTFESGVIATPVLDEHTFVAWTSDAALMHPLAAWTSVADSESGAMYAKFKQNVVVEEPEAYAGSQGLDQTIRLLDPAKLPQQTLPSDILFHGETADRYDNRFQTAFNGNQAIEFAFTMGRGTNTNGGDGSYQLSFSLPYVSIVDADGNVVAEYNDGAGLLRHYKTFFDFDANKTQGNTITAVKIGVDAKQLPAGTYTLKFSKDFGANNGTSFLGKDVDFQFQVEYPQTYKLSYQKFGSVLYVTGATISGDYPVDIVVPSTAVYSDRKEYPVVGIYNNAFRNTKNNEKIASVELLDSIVNVAYGSFYGLSGLQKVIVHGSPKWGMLAFEGCSDCVLWGYLGTSCEDVADTYDNVTFAALDDGIYANNVAINDGDSVALEGEGAAVSFCIMKDGKDVTTSYVGHLTDTTVAHHAGANPFEWNEITGVANGTTQLVLSDLAGNQVATFNIEVSGYSTDGSVVETPVLGYQGNGATIKLTGYSVTNRSHDETVDFFDNYIAEQVPVEGAVFALSVAGPGSAWGMDRCNWDVYKPNIDTALWLLNASGNKVASIGNGLEWVQLDSSNTLKIAVNSDVMAIGDRYTLVAGANLTGHNVASSLMSEIHWTFSAGRASIENYTLGAIDPNTWNDDEGKLDQEIIVNAPVPATSMWNNETKENVTTPAATKALPSDAFEVEYKDGDDENSKVIVVTGKGIYEGTLELSFAVSKPEPPAPVDKDALSNTVTSAQAYIESIPVSADGKDLTAGTNWVSADEKQEFEAVLQRAQNKLLDENATQEDVDATLEDLKAARTAFASKVKVASGPDSEPSQTPDSGQTPGSGATPGSGSNNAPSAPTTPASGQFVNIYNYYTGSGAGLALPNSSAAANNMGADADGAKAADNTEAAGSNSNNGTADVSIPENNNPLSASSNDIETTESLPWGLIAAIALVAVAGVTGIIIGLLRKKSLMSDDNA